MSIDEWHIHLAGARQRAEMQYEMMLHLAWHIGYLSKHDHNQFPSLAKYLKMFGRPETAPTVVTTPDGTPIEPWRIAQDQMRARAERDAKAALKADKHSRKAKT